MDANQRRKGYILTALGVLVLSPDALLIRLAGMDPAALVVWRCGLAVPVLLLWMMLRDRRFPARALMRGMRGPALIYALVFAISSYIFVAAIHAGPTADVLVVIATTPFIAALLGWIFLKERPSGRTLAAIGAGFIGVLIMMGGGGGALGIWAIYAFLCALMLAGQFVFLRRFGERVDNIAGVAIGYAIAALAGAAFGYAAPVPEGALLWVLLIGLIVTPISFALITTGPRYISAAEVSLLLLLETALGPLWTWLVLSETSAPAALIGGGIVIAALVLNTLRFRACFRSGSGLRR